MSAGLRKINISKNLYCSIFVKIEVKTLKENKMMQPYLISDLKDGIKENSVVGYTIFCVYCSLILFKL